jgi:hypothetical protein
MSKRTLLVAGLALSFASACADGEDSLLASEPPVALAASGPKYVGILYATWFDAICGNQTSGCPPTYPTDVPVPSYRYWGNPAIGKYISSDVNVIHKHADQIAAAGVDFVAIDYSNHNMRDANLNRPLGTLLQAYQERVRAGIPTPKVVMFMPTAEDEINRFANDYYSRYDTGVFFSYEGKPLLLTMDGCPFAACSRFTNRAMWGLMGNGNKWSFMEQYPQSYHSRNGVPEQISVSAAQQSTYMSDLSSARGRRWSKETGRNDGYDGKNFDDQWERAISVNPTFVFIRNWNEWTAIKLADSSVNGGRYTDEFNQEYSNDIEPMAGGHGDFYYQKLKQRIAQFKGTRAAFQHEYAYTLKPSHDTSKCLDVSGWSADLEANVHSWSCTGANNQKWFAVDHGDNWWALRSANSGLCLEVVGWSQADGGNIGQWGCHFGNNQLFQPVNSPGGSVRLLNRHSGKVIEVAGLQSTANGANVQQWTYDGSGDMHWMLSDAGGGYMRFASRSDAGATLRHRGSEVWSEAATGPDAAFKVVPGLAGAWRDGVPCVSFESLDQPGNYLRHASWELWLQPFVNQDLFRQDATFCVRPALDSNGDPRARSWSSWNFPNHWVRQVGNRVRLAADDGSLAFRQAATWLYREHN